MQNAPEQILKEVAEKFENSLVIPEDKQTPQWMLMPVGLIGAGKTTVVKPLSLRLDLVRISTDEIRQMLKEAGYSYEGVRDIAHSISKKYLSLGYSIAVDANTGSVAGLEYNAKTAEAFPEVHQIFIHINPPEEFIINKLKTYKHTWLFPDSESAISSFYKNKENFSLTNLPFVYEFDTSQEDLSEQIEEAATLIQNKLKTL